MLFRSKRVIHYKEVNQVLWRRGGGTRPLRLLVVRPVPYRKTKTGKVLYRQPAFLLTTDLTSDGTPLLQLYFDRWQIEVGHRELKDNFGLGQAQVRVPASVARQPVLTASTYSALHLAGLVKFGELRSEKLGAIPKYQRDKTRASCLDLIRILRDEVVVYPELLPSQAKITEKLMLATATI